MIKSTKQYALGIDLGYPDIWVTLMHRDVLFGFIPLNGWASRSLPSKDVSFLRKYLDDKEIKTIKTVITRCELKNK